MIIGSIVPTEGAVPQAPADLSDSDIQVLVGLDLVPDQWNTTNVLLALYNKTDNYDIQAVEISRPGMELSRSYMLEQIKSFFKNSSKNSG